MTEPTHPTDVPDAAAPGGHKQAGEAPEGAAPVSLSDEIASLLDDGRNYVEAEIAYQRSRAVFVGSESKRGLFTLLASFAFLHAALIALVVGALLALVPELGAVWAMLAVTAGLMLAALVTGLITRRRFGRISSLFRDTDDE